MIHLKCIDAIGPGVQDLRPGERVGIPWLGHTCGACAYCRSQQENLCDDPLFTGCTRDGGFATATIADARFAFPLGEAGSDVALAPLLCAGLIGWRSLVIAGDGKKLGLYSLLWEERELVSVANLTRQDGIDFLQLAPRIGIVTKTTPYPLRQANQALADLRAGRFEGAAVLLP